MRSSDVDILIVPGWSNSDFDHWQSRWQRSLKTASRVEQDDWLRPDRGQWADRVVAAVSRATRPVVLVGHSLGVATVLQAAPVVDQQKMAGAFLVSPSDLDAVGAWPRDEGQAWDAIVGSFGAMPTAPLPFSTRVVASSTDPFCSVARAHELGAMWGADVSILANAGHINSASGHGPWPEGLLSFGQFLQTLRKPANA